MKNIDQEKLDNFLEALDKVDPAYGKDIGIVVCEDSDDTESVLSNLQDQGAQLLTVSADESSTDLLNEMADGLKAEHTAVLHLQDELPQQMYNQLRLIAESARMQYFLPGGDKTLEVPEKSKVVLVATEQTLEELNYANVFEFGPVVNV